MEKDNDQWKLELLQTMAKHEKTIWDGIEFLCALVPDDQISWEQTSEIMHCIIEKNRSSLASALRRVLEIDRDERSNVE